MDAGEMRLVAEMVGIILFTAGGGAGALVYKRRRENGNGVATDRAAANEEVLRQSLHDARHGETLRILGGVAETVANTARASERAAEAAERAAESTERLSIAVERHLERCA